MGDSLNALRREIMEAAALLARKRAELSQLRRRLRAKENMEIEREIRNIFATAQPPPGKEGDAHG